jgi:hypothetical protein
MPMDDDIRDAMVIKWEGRYKDVGYEIAIDSDVEGDDCLKVFFYEKDMDGEYYASSDIIHHGYVNSLPKAHTIARKIIDTEMEDY